MKDSTVSGAQPAFRTGETQAPFIPVAVVPANAGTQRRQNDDATLGPDLRQDDGDVECAMKDSTVSGAQPAFRTGETQAPFIPVAVVPANAGTQRRQNDDATLGPDLRQDDGDVEFAMKD
ncbi:hypothetical protein [Herbaspirillum sp. RV1423]|uniref:hypothetical protein n=1 Tax=Herbaspirillum sp. RV1423 TaxID=1443993 RepID=UPI0004B89157|nr:hypothetical protein [Herbaspirillum sp. RV1423]